jgi:hypothetical protein
MRIKLSVVLLFVTFISNAQQLSDERISIAFAKTEIMEALSLLQVKSPWRFSYNPDAIPAGTINQSYTDEPLGFILNELLGEGFEYKIRGSYLIIQRRHHNDEKESNPIKVSGQIVDSKTGSNIQNVSIYEVNNLTASLSNEDGSYHLATDTYKPFTILAISKEHYKDTLITVSSLNVPILITLQPLPIKENPEFSKRQARFDKFINSGDVRQHGKNVELQEERLMQVSFLPVLGTNGVLGGKVSNKTSLNVIAGYSYGTNGAELGGVLNMNRGSMKGTQVAGVSNLVGDKVDGVQIAGASNTNLNYGTGLQLSGAMNSSGAFDGAQISGAYNYVKHRIKGLQLSGAMNYAGEVDGLQLSGAVNYTNLLNGVQLGVVNIAKKVDKGIMIGVINVAFENGIFRFELEHNDLTHYNVNLKTGTKLFHTVFSAGIKPTSDQKLWSYGMGFGSQFINKEKMYFGLDATSNTIQPLSGYRDGLTMDNRLNISYGINLAEHLSINFGPVIHYYIFDYNKPERISFYDSIGLKPFFKKSNQKAWVGYHIGIRF